ncbi:cellulose synthase [Kocuria rosea]|uniref:glycosyltransferase family 2 protein n=1 Tax=Kocuria rosea TaxID=1275 RepID=UPI000D647A3C|nr:glycosyltransferase family 2 protein [Kocuria rosea]PWF82209.1 cellulose synthase [Kocuria rosea]QCY33851.1 glycosyltransferase [Kocuria rosea]TQN35552.1 cellulose synthase (UDP-forming) [Kocuria rosea]VEI50664.1 Cellulose synthase catalytic subunit [UDP-forming] [Kocuria rosea]
MNRFLVRLLVVLTLLLGVNYIAWRWLESLNWSAWWIAVPLVLAETYSLIDVSLFGLTVWRLRRRGEAGAPPAGATVDVFITTYDEPLDLVMGTALAAQAIRHPHSTWILDDGARPELEALAAEHGLGYLTRSEDWTDRPRHAKAGNLNNALMLTQGEFLLILDADQVPAPEILDRTLGWFNDRRVALVQTPQWFVNVPDHDPLGSQAPLFYGPIQQGKDGWNAAFFCGSNAILRREALMQLGLSGYVQEVEQDVKESLARTRAALRRARRSPEAANPVVAGMLDDVEAATERARAELKAGVPLTELTYRLQREVDAAARRTVTQDFSQIEADLASIAALDLPPEDGMVWPDELASAVDRMSRRDLSPLAAVEPVREVLEAVSVDRPGEAQPVMPLATISVTEDMATAMRLHGLGWRSVYHHEVLAHGLAPEDLKTMLTQRLRWAQGTVQVLLRENPLLQRRLGWGQRLMYFATMWSYLSGFAAVVYFAAPIVYLVLGILPVTSLSWDFFVRFIPFMVVNQLLFLVVGRGIPTWRGQQYSLALFPIWIRACTTAARNVWFGRPLGFAVTPKVRQDAGPAWHLIRPQLVVMGLLAAALLVGTARLAVGLNEPVGTLVNVAWVAFDLVVLSVLVTAARYTGFEPEERSADAVHD